jgi:hypothetical protein
MVSGSYVRLGGRAGGRRNFIVRPAVYGALVPFSLIAAEDRQVPALIRIGAVLSAAGIIALLVFKEKLTFIPLSLLAAGSAFMTSSVLFIYAYALTVRKQIIIITAILAVKPLSSFIAILISDYAGRKHLFYSLRG